MAGADAVFNAPIPGQSLTQDPNTRGPWEMPPKYTTVNMAVDHLFNVVTSKDFIQSYNKLLMEDKKFYVDELVVGILSEGFVNGLWTVDTMVLLVEPLTILMVWAAAQLDRSPSFSSDSGFEDRTGFDELTDVVLEDLPEEAPETEEVPEDSPAPVPPVVEQLSQSNGTAAPSSPLVGGI